MTIFEFFVGLTHPRKRLGWEETTAYFTGEYRTLEGGRVPRKARRGYYSLMNVAAPASELHEYVIKYYAEDEERKGWYLFYPAPDPAPEDIKGMQIRIRYKKSRPWIFENISGYSEM